MISIVVGVLAGMSGFFIASFSRGRIAFGAFLITVDVVIIDFVAHPKGVEKFAAYAVIIVTWLACFIIGALARSHRKKAQRAAAKRRSEQRPRQPL